MEREFKILTISKKLVTLESNDKKKESLLIGANKNQHITEIWSKTKKPGDIVTCDVEVSDKGNLYLNEDLNFWERSQKIQRILKQNQLLDKQLAAIQE